MPASMTKKLKKASENSCNQKLINHYKIIIKCCTTGIVTLVVSIINVGWQNNLLLVWTRAWIISFLLVTIIAKWITPRVCSNIKKI